MRQVSHIRGTRRAFSGRAFFEIQTPTAVLSRGACCHIRGPGAVERGDIRFQGSPENARLVPRKWTSIRGPLGMRPPVPLAPHKIMRGPFLASIEQFPQRLSDEKPNPLAMLADALRACPCVSRGMMKGRGFGARAQHMPRRIFRRGRWCQCCRGCPWEAGLFGAAGSDDVVLIATPTAGGRVLATIRRKSLPKRCL